MVSKQSSIKNEIANPATASLTLSGKQVTVNDGDNIILTSSGTLTLNGQSASIEIEVNVTAGTGSLTITGNSVTVTTTSGGSGGLILVKDDRDILVTDKRTINIAA